MHFYLHVGRGRMFAWCRKEFTGSRCHPHVFCGGRVGSHLHRGAGPAVILLWPAHWCSLLPHGIKSAVKAVNRFWVCGLWPQNKYTWAHCYLYITNLISEGLSAVSDTVSSKHEIICILFKIKKERKKRKKKSWRRALAEWSKYYLLFVNHILRCLPEPLGLLAVEKQMGCLDEMFGVWYHVWWAAARSSQLTSQSVVMALWRLPAVLAAEPQAPEMWPVSSPLIPPGSHFWHSRDFSFAFEKHF